MTVPLIVVVDVPKVLPIVIVVVELAAPLIPILIVFVAAAAVTPFAMLVI